MVVFSNPVGPPLSIGPFKQIFMTGAELRETHDSAVLATTRNSRWEPEAGGRFSRFDCDVRCRVMLQDATGKSERYGPYRGFSSMNGLKFTDHQIFALLDLETEDFYGYESGQHWDTITVIPA